MTLPRPFTRHVLNALVLALAVLAQVEIWTGGVTGPKLAVVPLALLGTLPLLFRSRFPFAAPALVFAVLAAFAVAYPDSVTDGTSIVAFSVTLAFWIVGSHPEPHLAVAGTAVGLGAIAIISGGERLVRTGDVYTETVSWLALGGALSLAAIALEARARRAVALEERAAALEREGEARRRAAAAAERRRIARELHDVIAHNLSVMTVQAGAARLVLDERPERARAPLASVEETGRQALVEMRRLLGILRKEEGGAALAPQPGIRDLDALVAHVRSAGLPVELTVEGQPRSVPPGVALAAYRIVQEALTNALKHAGRVRAEVIVRYRPETLHLEITNEGAPAAGGEGTGHGLVGMRERVALYGGELDAGPRRRGGYAVRVRLPLEPAAP